MKGREDYFAALPPRARHDGRGSRRAFMPGTWLAGMARDAHEWTELDLRRMDSWGLNTIGNWSDPRLWDTHQKAYQVNLGGWGMRTGYLGLPDVYSEEFPKTALSATPPHNARRKRTIPGCWAISLPTNRPGRPRVPGRRLILWRALPVLSRSEAKTFLAAGRHARSGENSSFTALQRYLQVIIAAIRRNDPNHLIPGCALAAACRPTKCCAPQRCSMCIA